MHESIPSQPVPERLKKLDVIDVRFPERPTRLTFLLVKHTGAADLPTDLPEIVSAHDAVILEGLGWYEEELVARNAISGGDEDILIEHNNLLGHYGDRGFGAAINAAIFATQKPIAYCDMPTSKKVADAISQKEAGADIKSAVTVDHAIARGRSYFSKTFNSFILQRDRYMMKNLYGIVESVAATKPAEDPVSALIIYGAAHYNVAEALAYKLQQQGLTDQHEINVINFGEVPKNQSNMKELYRAFLKNQTLDDDLVIRGIIESIHHNMGPEMAQGLAEESGDNLRLFLSQVIGITPIS